MLNNRTIKIALLIIIPIVIMMIPPPQGLSPKAWKIFAIYVPVILGLMLKPFPEPTVLLCAIAASSLLLGNLGDILRAGYASTITWLIFAAFSLSTALDRTKLGRRIAYLLMYRLGHSTLGMCYVVAFLELILAPVTPSNTARTGGIVCPIVSSVSKALGSEPGESARKVGAFLMMTLFMLSQTTSYMFLTGMTANVMALPMYSSILNVNLTWGTWFIGAIVPGLLLLMFIPWASYKLYTPELRQIDGRSIAEKGLAELGPMSKHEKMLCGVFIMALLGWVFGSWYKIDAGTVALVAMAICLFTGIISWDDVLKTAGGWSTLVWFGGIIGFSGILAGSGFFKWLATWMSGLIPAGLDGFTTLLIIVFLSTIVRYLFASGTAYVAAMMPVFLTVGLTAGTPPFVLSVALAYSSSYGGMVTHYGGSSAPILYGTGYPEIKPWWYVGGILALVSYVVHMTIGVAWWKILGWF